MAKYIDPLVDYSFKRIFGSEPNKDLLISLLNGIFQEKKFIVDLVYNKNEHVGNSGHIGSVIFDLTCTDSNGSQFLIEVQRTEQPNLKKRMLYYASKLITDQAPKGKRSEWDYQISEVYVIVLMDGFKLSGNGSDEYLHDICLCNKSSGQIFYEELVFYYIELVNFVKEETDLQTGLDRWLYVLKHLSSMEKLPVYLRKSVFEKLFDIAEYSKLTKEEREMYDVSLKRRWDEQNVRNFARKKGYEEGIEQGIEQGIKQGKEQGKEQGKQEEAIIIATEMKKEGFSIKQIAKLTKLPLEEIKNL